MIDPSTDSIHFRSEHIASQHWPFTMTDAPSAARTESGHETPPSGLATSNAWNNDLAETESGNSAGVLCPHCRRRSLDLSYCEHCQFELPSGDAPPPTQVSSTDSASEWNPASICIRWPIDPSAFFVLQQQSNAVRFRGIRPELWADLSADVLARKSIALPALPPIQILEIGGGAVVAADVWHADPEQASSPTGATDPPSIESQLHRTIQRSRLLSAAMTELHASGHVWFEFDPQAVEIRQSQLRITNLDWRLFPLGRCPSRLARVSPKFSPPEICQFRDDLISPRTDVYHLALDVYYQLSGLGSGGFPGRGLEAFGFDIPPLRVYRPDLPVGVWNVLKRALSINAAQRHQTPGELIDELERVTSRGNATIASSVPSVDSAPAAPSFWQRVFPRTSGGSLAESPGAAAALPNKGVRPLPDVGRRFHADRMEGVRPLSSAKPGSAVTEIGWQTIAGRAKSALGSINQDCAIVRNERVRDREISLMIVADGVTHARVGDGALASGLACDTLVAMIHDQLQALSLDAEPDWFAILDRACLAAAEAVVNAAISLPDPPATFNDNDLMSTTMLIGILDGAELHLANVGDSRAYLVSEGLAEQLTVDGDVATALLAAGTPPEQVQELGTSGKALRSCLGACRVAADGKIAFDPNRSRPTIGRWTIFPDETLVLCSDGLVEEKVFLEPDDLVEIINSSGTIPAQELAERLVAAADARQRLPSATEPNGYGDNISCIVVQVTEHSPRDGSF